MSTVEITKEYYDSDSADNFYHTIWGGEDIHVGLYQSDSEPIFDASARTVERMASMVNITKDTKILDIGAGYGGAARHLTKKYGCKVLCNNLSEAENRRNEEKNKEQGLDDMISVDGGDFADMPYDDNSFDIVWCEDAILHSPEKEKVFKEVARVLKPGGDFIFTDPMQMDGAPTDVLQPILERIHLAELGSVGKYKDYAQKSGMTEKHIEEMPHQLVNHYSRVRDEIDKNYDRLIANGVEDDYIQRMKKGLGHWVDGGKNGYLNWGILHFVKG